MFAGRLVARRQPAAMKRELHRPARPLWDIRSRRPAAALARLAPPRRGGQRRQPPAPVCPREDKTERPRALAAGRRRHCQLRPVSMEDVFVERVTALEAEARMNRHRILAVASKEWREILRDRLFLPGFYRAGLLMLLFGYGLSLDVNHLPLGVIDYDRSASSRAYIGASAPRNIHLQGYLRDEHKANRVAVRQPAAR